MRILKRILVIILIIIMLPFVVALFVPKKTTVSVTEIINCPRDTVYNYVRMLAHQTEYSVWVMADRNLKPVIKGTDGEVGAIQSWNSTMKEVGEGEQQITSLTHDRMDMDLRFKRPFENTARAAYLFYKITETQSQLTAEFYSNDKWPMNLISYFIGRKMIREAQETNLKNIKRILETK